MRSERIVAPSRRTYGLAPLLALALLSGFVSTKGQQEPQVGAHILRPRITAAGEDFRTRCGWFSNPTPGNFSLYDKDREWIIGVQGGYQTDNFEAPVFGRGQWKVTNTADYGYGCACFQMKVDEETGRALEIGKSYSRPLAACRRDKALKKWLSALE